MTIAEFIQTHIEELLEGWEEFASTQLPAARGMSSETLQNFARGMLEAVAEDLKTPQSRGEQKLKSQGRHPESGRSLFGAGKRHGADRFADEFTQKQLVAELRALRARVVRYWQDRLTTIGPAEVEALIRFNESIDQLLVESLEHYDRRLEETAEQLDEAQRHERQLRDLNREKDHFLSMLAHELRNPLAPVLNAAQLLEMKQDSLDPPMQRAANVIRRQTQHLARLVDDLLDTARINSGRIQLQRELIDLADVAHQAAEDFRPRLESAGQDLEVTAPPEPLTVDADRHRIAQVLDNLLDNAVKFGDPAGGCVSVELRRDDDEAVLRVADTGRGIDPNDLPGLFDLFEQRRMNLDRDTGGLGLGLYLVRQLVELHGGRVGAHSEGEGHGSEFVVRLPLASGKPSEHTGGEEASRATARRVLVVEDHRDAAESMEMLLTTLGHEVRTAGDGPEGLAAAEAFRPDVALVDLGLPEMDGFEVARRLRSRFGSTLHIVALTGYSDRVYRDEAAEAGFDAHLVKPATVDDVRRALQAPE